jgi:membrane-bound ClpP family serine protease
MLYTRRTTNITEKYNDQMKKLIVAVSIVFVLVTFASMIIMMNEALATGKTSSTKNNEFLNGSNNVTGINWGKVINATLAQYIDEEIQNITNEAGKK